VVERVLQPKLYLAKQEKNSVLMLSCFMIMITRYMLKRSAMDNLFNTL